MAIIKEIIRVEDDNTLSFGNYEATEKQKVNDFNVNGDIYEVRTHKEVTRITKNSALLLESVPGSAVFNLNVTDRVTTFSAEGVGNTQFTLELESEATYKIYVDDVNVDRIKSSVTGKLSFSAELNGEPRNIKIEKN
ncbi:MAG: endosialidase [Lachnospirales bacterium]